MTTIHCPPNAGAPLTGSVRKLFGALSRRAARRNAIRHLSHLDDHVLRDIGFHRSIIAVAANAGVELVRAVVDETEGSDAV